SAGFYINWVVQFFNHCHKHPDEDFSPEELEGYLKFKSRTCEQWQLEQAREAIEVYRLWTNRRDDKSNPVRMDTRAQWKVASEEMTNMMRLKHLARRTEQAYLGWVRRFYRFVKGDPPGTLESSHVKNFMTHLAVERKVGASTQNQAFSALLFLFRHVLDQPLDDISEAVRAHRKKRIPVVLTQAEISALLNAMKGVSLLMSQVIYGGGLRLKECLQLRVKDIDIERKTIIIHRGKGDQDRETVLPESVVPLLEDHLEKIKFLHKKDRESHQSGVAMPGALEKKYPNAGKEWSWFCLFP
ncbi:MAG: tyrosine-type recombinase/integrase, partial [Desulfobacterales bacterium]|nr:tyrosine-type recombinase/integrase [Desulfobacterales bacterium]